LPGAISDSERCWLYQHCEAFLFPSKTEGFGLPVIEAMSLGRPVESKRTVAQALLKLIADEPAFAKLRGL
jgi:glycosyltransferase involved in cell wall biosynthesis